MSYERITKLTVRSIWPEKSPAPQGTPEFTAQDIAMGVANCNAIGGGILLHKYVFNQVTRAQCPGFYKDAWGLAIQLAIEYEWDEGPRGETWYRKLAHSALYEILSPALNCPSCKGAKFIGQRPCPACEATGRTHVGSDERAEALGIPLQQWNNGRPPWRARYEIIYRKLSELEGQAIGELTYQLQEQQ